MFKHLRKPLCHSTLLPLSTLAFCIASHTNSTHAALTLVDIFNNTSYRQNSINAPSSPFGAFFSFGADFTNSGDFNTGSANYPGPGNRTLNVSGNSLSFTSPYFSNMTNLHNTYPFGSYNITATNTNTNTSQTGTINYTTDYFTSTIPALTPASYTNLQNYNPASPLTVNFNAFTPSPNVTFGNTFFQIYDANTIALIFSGGFLPTTTTSMTIPANTLLKNKQYTLEIVFSDRLNIFDTPHNVWTLQSFEVRTDINFTTVVPEPLTVGFLGLGIGLFLVRRPAMKKQPIWSPAGGRL